jgi:hypothetical protein
MSETQQAPSTDFDWLAVRFTPAMTEAVTRPPLSHYATTLRVEYPLNGHVVAFPRENFAEVLKVLKLKLPHFTEIETNMSGTAFLQPVDRPVAETMVTPEVAVPVEETALGNRRARRRAQAAAQTVTVPTPPTPRTPPAPPTDFSVIQRLDRVWVYGAGLRNFHQFYPLLQELSRLLDRPIGYYWTSAGRIETPPEAGQLLIQSGVQWDPEAPYDWEGWQLLLHDPNEFSLPLFDCVPDLAGPKKPLLAWKDGVLQLFYATPTNDAVQWGLLHYCLGLWLEQQPEGAAHAAALREFAATAQAQKLTEDSDTGETAALQSLQTSLAYVTKNLTAVRQYLDARTQALEQLHMYREGGPQRQLQTQLLEISQLPGIVGVTEMAGRIHLITGPILMDYRNRRYNLGGYQIHLDVPNGRIHIYSALKPDAEHCHPHVRGAVPCFGNIKHQVYDLLNRKQYLDLTLLLLAYLPGYNASDAYRTPNNVVNDLYGATGGRLLEEDEEEFDPGDTDEDEDEDEEPDEPDL